MDTSNRDTGTDIRDTEINDTTNSSEKLLILPLGKESKKITQVITNDTARQIIELLADNSMSASDIAAMLDTPLTTIKYNLENLVDVGLIKIERIKYSEKGRKVKIYAPIRKLIVVVPEKIEKSAVMDMLKKYMGVVLAAVCASGLIELLTRKYATVRSNFIGDTRDSFSGIPEAEYMPVISDKSVDSLINTSNDTVNITSGDGLDEAITYIPEITQEGAKIPASQIIEPVYLESGGEVIMSTLTSHPGLLFLSGCLFIISLIIIIDYFRQKK